MSNTFVLSWDCLGLEACVNVTDIDKRKMWSTLKDEDTSRDPNIGHIVSMLTLRARYNGQRHYEIYAIDTVEEITEKDLKEMFEQDPQGSSDLIRQRGRQLYSDRYAENQIKIR